MRAVFLLVATVVCVYASNVTVPVTYPLFKQCNTSWGSINIGTSKNTTICQVGCLMSSVSMALNGKGITINGDIADPETLNTWLVANNGYSDTDMLQESVVAGIDEHLIQWVGAAYNNTAFSPSDIKQMLNDQTTIVILNVLQGHHFVLTVGYDDGETNFYVNDPGFETLFYTYSDIVGYRIFKMASNNERPRIKFN
eukprot:TRINITY_DN21480_c0_g1_i1.p1 TRINITY_DN21480_c0_g1~~TRINITY_DN21480_c0_g1_i1.p1  ORF type:complete len:197 (-),score=40.17 TRINITY_DN21480_c0_g1_i1:72-662(-)